MLSGAGAFCARVAENPSVRSAIEVKRDSVFIGDFMIDLIYCRMSQFPLYPPKAGGAERNPQARFVYHRTNQYLAEHRYCLIFASS